MAKKNGMRSWIKLMSASVSVHEVSVLQTKLLHEVLGNHPGQIVWHFFLQYLTTCTCILYVVHYIFMSYESINSIWYFFLYRAMCESERIKQLSDAIRLIPDFPSPGILFRFLSYFHAMVKLTRAISVDLNQTFNLAYIICRFELHKYMKLMREFKRNAALRYVMRNILIYQCPQ